MSILSLTLSSCLALLLIADLYLLFVHLTRRKDMLERDRRRLDVPPSGEQPQVCVQLPVHNEEALVGHAIDVLCALDWPRERLEILILDDASTDGSASIIQERMSLWAARGRRIRAYRRQHRRDYKAGLLAEGLAETKAQYIALFDVDCWPSPSILRELMTVLLANPHEAFVQARLDHRNRTRNWLTRAQAQELDTLLAYEHAARNWAGIPIVFNGTCAVWRREAIEGAGGWSGRSLAEDQDLSYRVFAEGWTCRFLVSVAVPGELPESFAVLATQRLRWNLGTAQQLHLFHHGLLRKLGWWRGAMFVCCSLFHAMVRPLLALNAVLVGIVWLWQPSHALVPSIALTTALAALVFIKSCGSLCATSVIGRPLGTEVILDVARMWALQALLVPNACRALIHAFASTRREFVRTRKGGEG